MPHAKRPPEPGGLFVSVSDAGNLMVRSALLRASRTMGRAAILRDASLRDAPQDEGLPFGQPLLSHGDLSGIGSANSVIARSSCDEAIQSSLCDSWIASLRSQ